MIVKFSLTEISSTFFALPLLYIDIKPYNQLLEKLYLTIKNQH